MAVDNKELTEKVKKASDYFSKLENLEIEEGIEVNNWEMIEAAAYAASVFGDPFWRKQINKKLRQNGIVVPDAVPCGFSSSEVSNMCRKYTKGERTFHRYTIEQARRLCYALNEYVRILEKEQQTQLTK